jgi:putative SOS response-associated peptidase YedK
MCGRYAFYSPSEATAALFGVSSASEVARPGYNIAPTQTVAAVRRDTDDVPQLVGLRWGLIPFWAKDPAIGNRMINARAETVAEKPSFRAAFRKRRCLVLADGFYEWHKKDGGKVPYFISAEDGEPFAFAGLWEDWVDKESGEHLQTTTIITTAANEFMSALHHRMPVVLRPNSATRWLDGEAVFLDDANEVMPKMRAWPVDRKVNNARNQGSELTVAAGEALSE